MTPRRQRPNRVTALLVVILVLMIGSTALGVAELYRQAEIERKANLVTEALAQETALRAEQSLEQSRFNEMLLRRLGRQGDHAAQVLRDILRRIGVRKKVIAQLFDTASSESESGGGGGKPPKRDGGSDGGKPPPSDGPPPPPPPEPPPPPPGPPPDPCPIVDVPPVCV